MLLRALSLAALAYEHVEQRLGPRPILLGDVFVDEGHRAVFVLGIGFVGGLPGEHRAGVIAEHFFAQLTELHQQLGALARRLRVALLLIDVAGRLVVVRRIERDLPERRKRRQVRRIQIEGHLVALLRGHAVFELFVERFCDAIERVDALLRVLRQIRNPRHEVDRLGRVAELVVELGQSFQRRNVVLVEVDDVLVRVDRALCVFDFVRVDLRDRRVEVDLRLPIERRRDVAVVRIDQLEPLPELAVVALQLEVGLFVVGVDLEDLLQPLARRDRP